MNDSLNIQFLGAARSVTGSKYLLKTEKQTTLIDCGLFQGLKELRLRNWDPFPFPPSKIDQIILTHAHIDHTGFLPRLVKEGFHGSIFCTPSTIELLSLLLPDCGHLQEEDARYAAKKGFSKHSIPLPLFTVKDAEAVLSMLQPLDFKRKADVAQDLWLQYHPTGHILGAASLELDVAGKRLWYSGDLGRYNDEVMNAPSPGGKADYIFIECTYGDRLHPKSDVQEELAKIINRTVERGGSIVIPAFAVGRTQTLLYHLRRLEDSKRIPRLPVYIDSPMAVDVSSLYCKFGKEANLRLDLTMNKEDCCPLRCNEVHFVQSVEESKSINDIQSPIIIVSASGMATGGRVVHHLANRLPDKRNTILLAGYQAEGTRGRALFHGIEELKMFEKRVPVRAEIASLSGLSAHGDQHDLMQWLSGFSGPPKEVFLIHGEESGLNSLASKIKELNWPTYIPSYLETRTL